jgi:hypothetical protein
MIADGRMMTNANSIIMSTFKEIFKKQQLSSFSNIGFFMRVAEENTVDYCFKA